MIRLQETSPLLNSQENIFSIIEHNIDINDREKFFDKYVIKNSKELNELHKSDRLIGSFLFTYDSERVGIHKGFYAVQKMVELFRACFNKSKPVDLNICHAMICVGWSNGKPELSHSVMDGVKVNRVDYFNPIQICCRKRATATKLIVYVPKDENFRKIFLESARSSAEISSEKANRSRFSWNNLIRSPFKKQFHKSPTELMRKELAYFTADILLKRKISPISKEDKTRSLFCTQYALSVLQASILVGTLSQEERNEMIEKFSSRSKLALELYRRIGQKKEVTDPISRAYWDSRICRKMDPKKTVSAYAAYRFDKDSDLKNLEVD